MGSVFLSAAVRKFFSLLSFLYLLPIVASGTFDPNCAVDTANYGEHYRDLVRALQTHPDDAILRQAALDDLTDAPPSRAAQDFVSLGAALGAVPGALRDFTMPSWRLEKDREEVAAATKAWWLSLLPVELDSRDQRSLHLERGMLSLLRLSHPRNFHPEEFKKDVGVWLDRLEAAQVFARLPIRRFVLVARDARPGLVDSLERLIALAPEVEFELVLSGGLFAEFGRRLMDSSAARRVTRITLDGDLERFAEELEPFFTEGPARMHLTALKIRSPYLFPTLGRRIASSPEMADVSDLQLDLGEFNEEGGVEFFRADAQFRHLRNLSVSIHETGGMAFARALVRARNLARLESLHYALTTEEGVSGLGLIFGEEMPFRTLSRLDLKLPNVRLPDDFLNSSAWGEMIRHFRVRPNRLTDLGNLGLFRGRTWFQFAPLESFSAQNLSAIDLKKISRSALPQHLHDLELTFAEVRPHPRQIIAAVNAEFPELRGLRINFAGFRHHDLSHLGVALVRMPKLKALELRPSSPRNDDSLGVRLKLLFYQIALYLIGG